MTDAQTCAKYWNVYSVCSSLSVVESVWTVYLSSPRAIELSSRPVFGGLLRENSSPFIVEGDGLTSQRKRESEYVC